MKTSFIKKPLFWIIYPFLLYYPYRYFVLHIIGGSLDSSTNDAGEYDGWFRGFFFFLTFWSFVIFCGAAALVCQLHFHTANKKLEVLKELIRVPDFVKSAKWIKYTKGKRWGVQAVITGENIESLITTLPVSTEPFSSIPDWAKIYFPENIVSIDIRKTEIFNKGELRKGMIYFINENSAYVEIYTKS